MIAEVLVIKGLAAICHWAAAHATAGVIAHAAHVVAGMTIGQLVTTTVTAGFIAGCVTWTADRIDNVKNGVSAISKGNYTKAIKEFASFALSSGVGVDMLPDTIEAGLEKMHLSSDETRKVITWVKKHELEIADYVKKHK